MRSLVAFLLLLASCAFDELHLHPLLPAPPPPSSALLPGQPIHRRAQATATATPPAMAWHGGPVMHDVPVLYLIAYGAVPAATQDILSWYAMYAGGSAVSVGALPTALS